MTVYEYIDENTKVDENCLTVDFYFDSNTTLKQAEKIVDKLVSKGDGKYENLLAHKPTVFVKSPFSD